MLLDSRQVRCWVRVREGLNCVSDNGNSEIPTARLRALNVALGAATQWLFNFIIARTVLEMKRTMGTAGYVSFPTGVDAQNSVVQ